MAVPTAGVRNASRRRNAAARAGLLPADQPPPQRARVRGPRRAQGQLYQHRASEEWLQALAPLGTDEHKPFLETAPWLIAVFLKKFTTDAAGQRHKNYYTAESVGIACGFLLAALHWSGLATLTHTPSPMKFLGEVLDRPDSERPYILVVTGYPIGFELHLHCRRRPDSRLAQASFAC
ncbi:MAG: hypothetical protein MUE63_09400 [Xanthomonadales bacterium]|nr:hypothetical protein [Xanthomonadales bacterium]